MSGRSHQARGETRMETMLRFALWVCSCHRLPSVTQVHEHFEVSRATAYRWLAAARAQRERTTT